MECRQELVAAKTESVDTSLSSRRVVKSGGKKKSQRRFVGERRCSDEDGVDLELSVTGFGALALSIFRARERMARRIHEKKRLDVSSGE